MAAVVKASELMHSIELKVTGLKGAGIRLWIAGHIFRFGAWVAGVGIKMEG